MFIRLLSFSVKHWLHLLEAYWFSSGEVQARLLSVLGPVTAHSF